MDNIIVDYDGPGTYRWISLPGQTIDLGYHRCIQTLRAKIARILYRSGTQPYGQVYRSK